jgi:hypothetical protein
MPWMKVDDRMAFHRKVLAAKNEAVGAWVRAGAWSSGEGTDGFIPRDTALTIAPEKVWKRLVECELAHDADGGWEIHDYLEYNPTAEESSTRRAARREAGKVGGRRSAEARRGKQPAKQVLEQNEANGGANAQAGAQSDAEASEHQATKQSSTPIPIPIPKGSEIPLSPTETGQPVAGRPSLPDPDSSGVYPTVRFARGTTGLEARLRYTDAVAAATGRSFVLSRDTRHDVNLCDLLNAHAPSGDLETAFQWLARSVSAWVATVDAQYAAGYIPAKFLDWLNAGRPVQQKGTGTDGNRRTEPDMSNHPSRRILRDEDL